MTGLIDSHSNPVQQGREGKGDKRCEAYELGRWPGLTWTAQKPASPRTFARYTSASIPQWILGIDSVRKLSQATRIAWIRCPSSSNRSNSARTSAGNVGHSARTTHSLQISENSAFEEVCSRPHSRHRAETYRSEQPGHRTATPGSAACPGAPHVGQSSLIASVCPTCWSDVVTRDHTQPRTSVVHTPFDRQLTTSEGLGCFQHRGLRLLRAVQRPID